MKKYVKMTTIDNNPELYPKNTDVGEVQFEAINGVAVQWGWGSLVLKYVPHPDKKELESETSVFGTSHFEFCDKDGKYVKP